MAFGHLRRYDVQATYACALSLVSVMPFLAASAFLVRNYHHELGQIVYGARGLFLPAFLGCVFLSAVPGALGFLLGLSSAGQRRNDKPLRSWIGFFVGGGVLASDFILVIAFWMLRFQQPM